MRLILLTLLLLVAACAPEPEDLSGLYVHRCWDGPPGPGCKE